MRPLLAATATAVTVLTACSSLGPAQPPARARTPGRTQPPAPAQTGTAGATVAEKQARPSLIFGPGSVFRTDISRAPLAPTSKQHIADLMGQITPNYGGQVAFNAHQFNTSLFVAEADTKKVRVHYTDCQQKGPVQGLYDGPKHFVDVPIPPRARPPEGTDKALTIWSPSSDQLWELWIAEKNPRSGQWSACWGGRIDRVSTASRGVFPYPYGTSASGLATAGSVVSVAEAQAGRIEHAVQLQLISPKQREFVWPANRTDGSDASASAIPIGARLRLPASVDVESLGLHPLAEAIARAAQRYGFVVTETAGAVAVVAESPNALLASGRKDPWPAVCAGVQEYDVLKGFPWDRLEVVELGYGAPRPQDRRGMLW